MNTATSERQRVLLALLDRIKQAAPKERPALRIELLALVASYQQVDRNGADFGAKSAARRKRKHGT